MKRDRPGVEVTLTRGSGGVFEVVLDGQLIFSKKQSGRFPTTAEVMERIPVA